LQQRFTQSDPGDLLARVFLGVANYPTCLFDRASFPASIYIRLWNWIESIYFHCVLPIFAPDLSRLLFPGAEDLLNHSSDSL
jgi:hypothetical protein